MYSQGHVAHGRRRSQETVRLRHPFADLSAEALAQAEGSGETSPKPFVLYNIANGGGRESEGWWRLRLVIWSIRTLSI